MNDHQEDGLKPGTVALVGGAALGGFYLLFRFLSDRGTSLPQNTWITVAVLALLSGGLLHAAWQVRSYVRGALAKRPSPQFARRVLVGSRASSIAGSVLAGFYAAQAFVRSPHAGIPTQASAMWLAAVLALVSIGLAVAGLIAQSWCRIPPEDEDRLRRDDPEVV